MYKHWNKDFFPPEVKKKDWLPYLATKFNTVELNTTFYHFPKAQTFENWAKQVPKGFVFTSKLNRVFTHFLRLKLNDDDWNSLKFSVENTNLLRPHLGPVLIQCPPNLKFDLGLLSDFCQRLRTEFNKNAFALEFRNKSWLKPETYDTLKKNKLIFVISDSPRWPTETIRTDSSLYIRFHGQPKLFSSKYKNSTLVNWVDRILDLKPRKIFAYFNNDDNANAPKNAEFFRSVLFKQLEINNGAVQAG